MNKPPHLARGVLKLTSFKWSRTEPKKYDLFQQREVIYIYWFSTPFCKICDFYKVSSGVEVEKLDAVLGGLLRLIHFSRKEGSDFKINQKMNYYFRKRLKLNKKQVSYLIYMAKEYRFWEMW